MPLTVDRNNMGHVQRLVIACETCGEQVDDLDIEKGGGLIRMGWLRRFNTQTRQQEYFCPSDNPEKEQSRGN